VFLKKKEVWCETTPHFFFKVTPQLFKVSYTHTTTFFKEVV